MFRVIRTKYYSLTQMQNMARNLSVKYNSSISLERIITYSRSRMDREPKLRFELEIQTFREYTISSWIKLQNKYFSLMELEVK